MNIHFLELRKRLLHCSVFIIGMFIILFTFSDDLYTWIATPLLRQLPPGGTLIATQVTAPFLVPMKLSFIVAIIISMPFLLYNIWAFIAPGLYKHERKTVLPMAVASSILFYFGMAFAFYVICPLALGFFAKCSPQGVTVMTDITSYLDFMLTILIAAGMAFQIPIFTAVIIKLNIMSKQQLAKQRPLVIVGAFVLGMLLTPPDVVSQILLALPMWGLFELGLIFSTSQKQQASEQSAT